MKKEEILKHARLQHIPSGYLEAIDLDPEADPEVNVSIIAAGYKALMSDLVKMGVVDPEEVEIPAKPFDKAGFDKYLDEHFPKSTNLK